MVKSKKPNKDVFWWAKSSSLDAQATPLVTVTLSVRNLRTTKGEKKEEESLSLPVLSPFSHRDACVGDWTNS